jgi:hypothetical protein
MSILSAFENTAISVSIFEGAHQNRRNAEGAQDARHGVTVSTFGERPWSDDAGVLRTTNKSEKDRRPVA